MKPRNYLLDTHVIVNLLNYENAPTINKNFKEEFTYYQNNYYISVLSILEIIQLFHIGRLSPVPIHEIFQKLMIMKVKIISTNLEEFKVFEKIPIPTIKKKRHSDPFDRMIIATAISNKITLASKDDKFPYYSRYGLDHLDVSA
jgi:PIN domain nuclease of toxin-antitoxin system